MCIHKQLSVNYSWVCAGPQAGCYQYQLRGSFWTCLFYDATPVRCHVHRKGLPINLLSIECTLYRGWFCFFSHLLSKWCGWLVCLFFSLFFMKVIRPSSIMACLSWLDWSLSFKIKAFPKWSPTFIHKMQFSVSKSCIYARLGSD